MPGTVEYTHEYAIIHVLRDIQSSGAEGSLQTHTCAHTLTYLSSLAAPVKGEKGAGIWSQVHFESPKLCVPR